MKKKVLIINPANFYNYIIHNTEFFGDVQIEILNIEINLEAIQNSSINFNFFDCVYYDDFNNFENFSFFLKHLNFADKKKVSVFSLLIQFENFYQKSAIFKVNNEIFFPDYIVSLNENKGINLLLRVADILFVIILSPLVIFTLMFSILLLKIFSNGPVLFRQIRVRKNGKPFAIYKLRTMYVSSNEDFTKFNDDRIFPLGKYR